MAFCEICDDWFNCFCMRCRWYNPYDNSYPKKATSISSKGIRDMKVQTYDCKNCKEPFASRKNPKAEKSHDRPQCSNCGERV